MECLLVNYGEISFLACSTYVREIFRFDDHHLCDCRIRAAIRLTMPNRQQLITKLLSKRTTEEIDVYAEEIVQACNIIDRTTQELFETHRMTKLP